MESGKLEQYGAAGWAIKAHCVVETQQRNESDWKWQWMIKLVVFVILWW